MRVILSLLLAGLLLLAAPDAQLRLRFVLAPAAVPEASGWTNVTPADANVTTGDDNFGASGHPVVDPTNPAVLYAGFDLQGIWRSVDYGKTWTKRNAVSSIVESGKIWCLAMAPDGSYLLACSGFGSYFLSTLKSTNGGVTWTEASAANAHEAYAYEIDPASATHVIATSHTPTENTNWYESTNAGTTWTDRGSHGGTVSSYIYFGLTSATVLLVSDGDSEGGTGTRRATWNGSVWSAFTQVSNARHNHGSHHLYVDRTNGLIWNAHSGGIDLSDDDGVTWIEVDATISASILRVGSLLLSGNSYATGGSLPGGPLLQTAPYPDGDTFTPQADPAGMTNGPRAMVGTLNPAGQRVIVTCNWRAGLWRYVVPRRKRRRRLPTTARARCEAGQRAPLKRAA